MNPHLFALHTGIEWLDSIDPGIYFKCVAVGFIFGAIVLRRFAKRNAIDGRLMIDFVLWMAIWGVVGSRLLHVIADGHFWDYVNVCIDPSKVDWKVDKLDCQTLKGAWDAGKSVCHPIQRSCWAWADLMNGGFAFYGGFTAAGLFSMWFMRRHRLPVGKIADIGATLLMLGLAWGRMGCSLAGCCFGMRTDSALGVVFPRRSPASHLHFEQGFLTTYRHESLPVYFTQVYEAAAGLAIAAIAYFILSPRKRFHGQVFCISAALYAAARFGLEFIRSDERGGALGLSTSQLFAIAFLGFAAFAWVRFRKASKKAPPEGARSGE